MNENQKPNTAEGSNSTSAPQSPAESPTHEEARPGMGTGAGSAGTTNQTQPVEGNPKRPNQ